jgi:nuclear pore complex protein Nup54
MRLVEALEGRSHPNRPLSRGESALLDKLRSLVRQMKGPSAELPRRVESLLLNSRLESSASAGSVSTHGRIDEKSLANVQALLAQQTEAMQKLAGVLKKDARDAEIIAGESKGRGRANGVANGGLVFDDRLRRTPF